MKNQFHNQSRQAGVTLIEIIVVVAIIGILAGMAAPSFIDFIRAQRAKGAAEGLQASLFNAKAEAVKTNSVISIVFTPTTANTALSTWCFGMTSTGTATCDCSAGTCAPGSGVNSTDFPNVTLNFNASEKRSFHPLRGGANGTQGTAIFDAGNNKTLGVRLSTYGRITMCRPAGTNLIGYSDSEACP